jgi:hypothetical protein
MPSPKISSLSPLVILGITVGASLVLSTVIGAFSFYKVRSFDDSLSVTGSARVNVTSDQVKWTASFSRQIKASGLKSGYQAMTSDLKKVLAFYGKHGVQKADLLISPISMDEVYDYSAGAESREKQYVLRQSVELSSSQVVAVKTLADDVPALVLDGVIFQTQSLEYYYSKLPELRVSLLSDAVTDAKARAERIAESSGRSVGTLKSAAQGVVQVLPANSVEVSDYGAYDTSRVEKQVMVTVRAAFTIR